MGSSIPIGDFASVSGSDIYKCTGNVHKVYRHYKCNVLDKREMILPMHGRCTQSVHSLQVQCTRQTGNDITNALAMYTKCTDIESGMHST